jgi:electron transport complex protein RnfC
LNVTDLNDAFELSLLERARRGGAAACVECGVCSYVCPARLPLTHRVKQLKRRLSRAADSRRRLEAPHP